MTVFGIKNYETINKGKKILCMNFCTSLLRVNSNVKMALGLFPPLFYTFMIEF